MLLLLFGWGTMQLQEADSVAGPPLPPGALEVVDELNTRDADLREVLRALALQHGLNLLVDEHIDARVTLRLAGLTVFEVLTWLASANGLELDHAGAVFRIFPAGPPPLRLQVNAGRLSVDARDVPLDTLARALAKATGHSVLVRRDIGGTVTGYLQDAPLETGLSALLEHNGYTLRQFEGIFEVDRVMSLPESAGAGGLWIGVRDSLVDIDLRDAGIAEAIHELARRREIDLVAYDLPEGTLTARVTGLSVDEAMTTLLHGTGVAFRRDGNRYVVGDGLRPGIATTRLITLRHLEPEGLAEQLPEALRRAAAFQPVEDQQALLVTAAPAILDDIETVIRQLDLPTPQILIEALVVDFEATDLSQLGITLGRGAETLPAGETYVFGDGADQSEGITLTGGAREATRYVDALAGLLGVGSIGRLPADFYFRLHALEQEGKAQIRSRPRIATLHNHTAHIRVGTTQYYLLKTLVPYSAAGQVNEAEHFERVEANVTLEITPRVGATGEVIAEIRPTFATPVGALDPRVPPTINNRSVETTVRLRDGETVVIGGLIQEGLVESINKVPILGDLPLLGRLFRNRRRDTRRSELVIFITPHVFRESMPAEIPEGEGPR